MTCEVCGGEIAPARLRAVPEATRCIGCQREWEKVEKVAVKVPEGALAVCSEMTLHEYFG